MGEVGGGVPIGGGDDEPVEVDMRTKQRGGQCTQASPRAPSISPSRIVGDGAGAGEVDADVKVEARGRQAVGDAIPISDQAKEEDTTRASRVEPPVVRRGRGRRREEQGGTAEDGGARSRVVRGRGRRREENGETEGAAPAEVMGNLSGGTLGGHRGGAVDARHEGWPAAHMSSTTIEPRFLQEPAQSNLQSFLLALPPEMILKEDMMLTYRLTSVQGTSLPGHEIKPARQETCMVNSDRFDRGSLRKEVAQDMVPKNTESLLFMPYLHR
ncbi:hypothetical protein SETIT_1G357200v2 [Setaria italica]|uniref:Uncharacterized protein n=1 Tax=Setaria italica TaxID=4555 RepID=A0A368PSR2_SETIT|nr:hypothetical protein SETIT_1G357200v2 [Setaria italica]